MTLDGLTVAEAARRLAEHGPNRLVARERAAWIKEAAGLLLDPMTIMLLVAGGLYLALGETRDGVVMLSALIPVVGVDVLLEARSRAALKQLARRVAPRARVVRDGREVVVDMTELVPGDLLVLGEGDVVHADGVLRQGANLAFDESPLTGEAEPQGKRAVETPAAVDEIPDDARFFAGSVVLSGAGLGEVVATGSGTRFGEIARLVATVGSSATPLQRRVGQLVRRLAIAAAVVAVAVFALGLARGQTWSGAFLGGVSLAMAAIPEEFPLIFALFLGLGAFRLAKRGVLVRRLASVETLGSTTVICTDKTGTLTEGRFAVEAALPLDDPARFLEACVLACEISPRDPMEQAIVAHAAASGVDAPALHRAWRLVRDHDFDPVGKHMSHVWGSAQGAGWVVAKGALEGILEHCAISPQARAEAEAANARLASAGLRVLAVGGRRDAALAAGTREDDERDLALQGLLGFGDPIRPEVAAAVAECTTAGIAVKLVTGDHALTARAIAERAGIGPGADVPVLGAAVSAADPEERGRLVRQASAFARVTPGEKHLIVETLRKQGEIVAMTGDGINDAPALRTADIGISMGRRGTEVARAASALVLLDDNFASIVAAVREGRKIFLDIQRSFLYLLAFHMPIVGLALLVPVLGLPLLLLPIHLVWLELVVHPVSALVFQGDPAPADLMRRPPRDPAAPMLPRPALVRSLASGGLLTAAVLAAYAAYMGRGAPEARALALATLLVGYQLLMVAERAALGGAATALFPRWPRFWIVWVATGASLPLLMYTPAAAATMRLAPLDVSGWLLALVAGGLAVGWRLVARPRADHAAGPGSRASARRMSLQGSR